MVCFVQLNILAVCIHLLCLHSISALEATNHADDDPILVSKIIESVSGLCPAKVCSVASHAPRNASLDLSQCCGGCSCEADCHSSDSNCCFEQDERPYGEECIIPSTGTPDPNDLVRYIRYRMISSCPSPLNTTLRGDIESVSDNSCQNTRIAPWGSLFPVYSHTSKTFYTNQACAQCNGDYNTTAWTPMLACTSSHNRDVDIDTYTQLYFGRNIYDVCQVNFIPPVGWSDILERKRCYKHYIDTCLVGEFVIPAEVKLTKGEVIQACESNFFAPFVDRGFNLYKNIFCNICSRPGPAFFDFSRNRCQLFFQEHPRLNNQLYAYTSFIDLNLMQTMPRVVKRKLACNKNKTECHEVHCPSARLRMKLSGCIFLKAYWSFERYTLALKLTPTTDMRGIQETTNQHFRDNIINPWPKQWTFTKVGLHVLQDSNKIDYMVIEMQLEYKVNHPERMLQVVKKYSSRPWYYMNNDTKLELLSVFSPFKYIKNVATRIFAPSYTKYEDNRSNVSAISWLGFVNSFGHLKISLTLSKMFFCDQVELNDNEYILLHGARVLYYIPTQRYFFDGEFVLIMTDQQTITLIRICLEDSGLQLQAMNKVGKGCKTDTLLHLVVTIVTVVMRYVSM